MHHKVCMAIKRCVPTRTALEGSCMRRRYATRIFAPDEHEVMRLAGATKRTLACAAHEHGGEELTEQAGSSCLPSWDGMGLKPDLHS